MKLVLDSNIYLAAYLDKGLTYNIVRSGEKGIVDIYVSPGILSEIKEKLEEKFKADNEDIQEFFELIDKSTNLIYPESKIDFIKADPDDDKILECAVGANANIIVSMDKHLLKLKTYQKIGIVHPKTLTWIMPKLLE